MQRSFSLFSKGLFTMVALLLSVSMLASAGSSPTFGQSGAPVWQEDPAPSGLTGANQAGEPTIGIPWDSGAVMYMANEHVFRITYTENGSTTWELVTPDLAGGLVGGGIPNLDPMLHSDPITGRTWAGGLLTACSLMYYTDDDGETWDQTGNMCGIYGVDHQTIGSGPWTSARPPGALYERAVYYCAHGEAIDTPLPLFAAASPTACLTSLDGGVTWGPPVPWVGGCGSLHGHVKVGPTGFAAVPDADCSVLSGEGGGTAPEFAGFAYSDNNGATWMSRTVAGSTPNQPFDNPGLDFGHDAGWLWYGQAADNGAFVALSKDNGLTWEDIGAGMGQNATTWLDVGRLHDPPIVAATFAKVVAGDDDRVAFSFLGVEEPADGKSLPDPHQCTEKQELLIWHYYVAMSYDAGLTWRVQRLTADPVQIGGIWQGQVPGDQDPARWCRNLLDFNDMDIDAQGRLYISFADGCTGDCIEKGTKASSGYRDDYATMLRQVTGNGLFAGFDVAPPGNVTQELEPGYVNVPAPNTATQTDGGKESPGPMFVVVLALMVAVVMLRRRNA